ncbi:hypothetical protein BJ546DRAFT_1004212 [Cryomyces antarcticus]|uniref:Short-chain alcohol dehydrogenase n=1 Tax=Cryomyces antarcticus TaxID=329879 RepID=A0ABR0KUT6_9PEZI|nr:short-chain alcohol dehydrogenase [Cryomyces antarcticus]KAK5020973.1 short-chain alcohol dehydrogenase [Cryomyces antarcticus]KAK5131971.1 short-chain alcohol dehydrogenase [Cryomyces antarcticus]
MGNILSQSFFLPEPVLTEKNLKDQHGKVFIVTGGYVGVGFELSKILYQHNGTVYIAGRSQAKGDKAISSIKSAFPSSKGRIELLLLDLQDLTTIKHSAEEFLAKESRLDVLTNNAGVMMGYEVQMATNCLGHFLFTSFLLPTLKSTAESSSPGSVRVTWAGSLGVDTYSPKPGGMLFDSDGSPKVLGKPSTDYGTSKVGNVFLAAETARRYGKDGIVSVAWNPGNLQSELQRHVENGVFRILSRVFLHKPVFGAYTELFAGWSPDVTPAQNGAYIIPWGRFGTFRNDIVPSTRPVAEGGNGKAEKFWEWCDKETRQYR